MGVINLADFRTKDLVRELEEREGIKVIPVSPHENYNISAGETTISNTGPVIFAYH